MTLVKLIQSLPVSGGSMILSLSLVGMRDEFPWLRTDHSKKKWSLVDENVDGFDREQRALRHLFCAMKVNV